jgi:hypothetical protein
MLKNILICGVFELSMFVLLFCKGYVVILALL